MVTHNGTVGRIPLGLQNPSPCSNAIWSLPSLIQRKELMVSITSCAFYHAIWCYTTIILTIYTWMYLYKEFCNLQKFHSLLTIFHFLNYWIQSPCDTWIAVWIRQSGFHRFKVGGLSIKKDNCWCAILFSCNNNFGTCWSVKNSNEKRFLCEYTTEPKVS